MFFVDFIKTNTFSLIFAAPEPNQSSFLFQVLDLQRENKMSDDDKGKEARQKMNREEIMKLQAKVSVCVDLTFIFTNQL